MTKISVESADCRGCGLCIYYCPKEVFRAGSEPNKKGFAVVEVFAPGECIGCKQCEINCPDLAITVEKG